MSIKARASHVLEKTSEEARKLELGFTFAIVSNTYCIFARFFSQLLSPVIWDGETCGLGEVAGEGLISRKGYQYLLRDW